MKKNYLLLGLLLVAGVAFAQNLRIVSSSNNVYGAVSDFRLVSEAVVENVGARSIDVKCRRYNENILLGTINYFCWENCYSETVDESPLPLSIAPNQAVSNFVGDYEPNGAEGISTVRYKFFDMNNPDDSVDFRVNYVTSQLSLNEQVWVVTDPYPNPANTNVTFDYTAGAFGNAEVLVYDMLGNTRKVAKFNEGASKLTLNVADMEPGVYFYSIKLNGSVIMTKKLVVNRN